MLRDTIRAFVLCILLCSSVHADVFSMPSGQKDLELVTVGDLGNAADATGHGSVGYEYQIGKYEVTSAQYCQFLNAVAKSDVYHLYHLDMALVGRAAGCGILRSGSPGNYSYSVKADSGTPGQPGYANYANYPVNSLTWGDAARFCNWLTNGQPTGPQGPGTTETGAYTLSGATSNVALMAVTRSMGAGAIYALPTEDEWYKAAYYKGGDAHAGYWQYPTQSDTAPVNILSATGTNNANFRDLYHTGNGDFTDPINMLTAVGSFEGSPGPYMTFDMGGNVSEWDEVVILGLRRGLDGGCYFFDSDHLRATRSVSIEPASSHPAFGFRVIYVPEPTALSLIITVVSVLLLWICIMRFPRLRARPARPQVLGYVRSLRFERAEPRLCLTSLTFHPTYAIDGVYPLDEYTENFVDTETHVSSVWISGAEVIFDTPGVYTVDCSYPTSLTEMAFANGSYTITGEGIALVGTPSTTVSVHNTAGTATIDAELITTAAFSKGGTGILRLTSGNNDFSDGFQLLGGALDFSPGSLGSTGQITIAPGSGNSTALVWGGGSGTNSTDLSDRLVLQSGELRLDLQGNAIAFQSANTGITGNGSLKISDSLGGGVLTLNGTNYYGGKTIISGGTAKLGSSTAIPAQKELDVFGGLLDLGTYTYSASSLVMTDGAIYHGSLSVPSGQEFLVTSGTISAHLTGGGALHVTGNQGSRPFFLSAPTDVPNSYSGGTQIDSGDILVYRYSALIQGTPSGSGTTIHLADYFACESSVRCREFEPYGSVCTYRTV